MALGLSLLLLGVVRLAEKPPKGIEFVQSKLASDGADPARPGMILSVSGGIVLCVGVVCIGVATGAGAASSLIVL